MFIVGEKINTSRKKINQAVVARDADYILKVAGEQLDAGADMIDVNAGTLVDGEPDALRWLVQIIQERFDVPLCIDSPNSAALLAALSVHKGRAMVNSVTMEKERMSAILPVVLRFGCKVVALCMDDNGIPDTAQQRLDIARRLVARLESEGINREDIYLDPLVRPISTGDNFGMAVLDTLRGISAELPGVHTICGLSNVSYGLPERALLNRTFLAMCIASGLDSAILDPNDNRLMACLHSAWALAGRDKFCRKYLKAHRAGKLSADV
ncbi:MAG: methyltetrahydrofolate cobalamin methyltransferase [Bacillota bacterium]